MKALASVTAGSAIALASLTGCSSPRPKDASEGEAIVTPRPPRLFIFRAQTAGPVGRVQFKQSGTNQAHGNGKVTCIEVNGQHGMRWCTYTGNQPPTPTWTPGVKVSQGPVPKKKVEISATSAQIIQSDQYVPIAPMRLTTIKVIY